GIPTRMFEPFKRMMAHPAEPDLMVESGVLPPEILENFVEEKNDLYLVYFSVKTTKENTKRVNDCLTAVEGCMLMNPYYYCKNLIELIRDDFNLIMWISLGFVLLLLLCTYRNIWITLIALVPMVLSWYTVLGAMALFGQPFNLVNIIVSSFVFGIGVDYSVFIMEGLLKGHENNPTMVYNKTAITMSAVILVICMFVLGFAIHPAVQSISFASLVGMITTIMLSYTLEPILFRFYMKCKNRKKKENNK
ncbi:MAG: MMPL family transporter, partial [Bacteroidales bacterium]|nr:MMPL family transporter [Bacteroidales bacterium]